MLKLELQATSVENLAKAVVFSVGVDALVKALKEKQSQDTPLLTASEAMAETEQSDRAFSGHSAALTAESCNATLPPEQLPGSELPEPQSQLGQPTKGAKRGRPRKDSIQVPAGALQADVPSSADSVPATQPAVVENTGSPEPSVPSPSVGDPATSGDVAAGEAQAPAATATAADMRAALQALNTAVGGDEGLTTVGDVLRGFGYEKISSVTNPEHFASIRDAANVKIKQLQQEG